MDFPQRGGDFPDLQFEFSLGFPDAWVAGADEVGRGCLAGPVVAAAVVLPKVIDLANNDWLLKIQDSKQVKESDRELLAVHIQKWAAASAVGVATVAEIDSINIHQASHLAIRRAIEALSVTPSYALIDGKWLPKGMKVPCKAVIKGDIQCLSIAAASIIAKVWRDHHMQELESRFPGYGFAQNKGYPTPSHKAALRKIGMTETHRRSFKPVMEVTP